MPPPEYYEIGLLGEEDLVPKFSFASVRDDRLVTVLRHGLEC